MSRDLHIISKGVDYFCKYDECDQALIDQHKWHLKNGYASAATDLMHRLILGVTDPGIQVDHIDHDKLNNQRSNLRACTRSENQHNRQKQKSSSSYKGVRRYAGRYFAQIRCNGEYKYLGLYKNERTAARVYDRACRELHKEFAFTNFKQMDPEPCQLSFFFRDINRHRNASLRLIEKAASEGWMKQLAFYHLLKHRYNNSCLFDYRSRMNDLAAGLEISSRTLYNYLAVLRAKGLVCDHENNLKILSIDRFRPRRHKCIIQINDHHNLNDIRDLLSAKLIEQRARQQAFAESVRRFGRGDRSNSVPGESPFLPSFSVRSLAKLLNCSKSEAHKIIKNLERLGVLRVIKQRPQLISKDFTALETIEDLPGYRYNIGRKLFEQFGCKIELLQYPVFIKNVTFGQFKKHYINDLQNYGQP